MQTDKITIAARKSILINALLYWSIRRCTSLIFLLTGERGSTLEIRHSGLSSVSLST